MTSEILGEYIPERMIMNKYLKNLDRIEFVVTMACTGRCKHCSEGEHTAAGEHIDGEILLSADAFHQETIPLETVLYFGECVTGEGIPVKLNPAWLVSREHDNPYNMQTREIMKAFADMQISADLHTISFKADGSALGGNINRNCILDIIAEYRP